jgi:hypothetical protein
MSKHLHWLGVAVAHDDEKVQWVRGERGMMGEGCRGKGQTQQKNRKRGKSQSAVLIKIFPLHLSKEAKPPLPILVTLLPFSLVSALAVRN